MAQRRVVEGGQIAHVLRHGRNNRQGERLFKDRLLLTLSYQGVTMTEIEIIPCLSDNYAYLVKSGTACAVVDPSEAAPVQAALARTGWKLTHILNTHHHLDHCGGNLDLKHATGASIV